MQLLPKQSLAWYYLTDDETDEILYGGAAGGGKSALGCIWLMNMALKFPGTRWLLGRSKLHTLKATTLKTFHEQAKKNRIEQCYKFNGGSLTFHFHNGSEIICKDLFSFPSDPDFDSLGSLEITGGFVDEVSQITIKAWQILKSRIRFRLLDFAPNGEETINLQISEYDENGEPCAWIQSNGKITTGLMPKLLGSCNPSKTWIYKQFYFPNREKTLPVNKKFIPSLPKDNKFLPKAYLNSLLTLDRSSRERLYYGNWEYDDDPATLIDIDSITAYFNPIHIPKIGQKYMTIDVARKGKDKTVFRVWHGWVCIHRFEIGKSDLTEVVAKARLLQREYAIPITNVVADEDGVGGGVVDFLKCKGFINHSSALNDEDYANLKSQCSIKMAHKIVAKEVGEICTSNTIIELVAEEMEQVKLKNIDKDGKQAIIPKEEVKKNIGRSPDDWDSIMMRFFFEHQKSFATTVRINN